MAEQDGPQKISGRRAKNRKQLLFEFDMQRDTYESEQHKKDYFIGDAYPPSTKRLDQLKPTSIADLQPDARKQDTVLFVRTLDVGIFGTGLHNIVEDDTGAVERLVLYNSYATNRPENLAFKNACLAVKEPFLEISATGSSCIRVDHPSDLVPLRTGNPLIPDAWRAQSNDVGESSPLDWKTKGNASYKAGDNAAALEAFTQGLTVCGPKDVAIQRDLLRNRAIVNTYLKRFEFAVADAKGAVIETDQTEDEQTASLNSKAYFRAGRAAYELREFKEAKDYFTKAKDLTPTDKDTQRELDRVEQRLKEKLNGDYDFEKMSSSVSKKHNKLDYADFLTNIETRDAGSHGNGLFATSDIKAGELILCEKAFCIAFDSDSKRPNFTVLDAKSQRQLAGTQASLLFDLIGRLISSPRNAGRFFDVYDAGYPSKTSTEIIDDTVPVDIFRVQAIVQHNSFGCPTTKTTSKEARKQATSSTGYPSTGLWITAAYTNHACNGNAMRSFIGDMMIMRATRDIKKDDEVLMPYRLPSADYEATQAELKKIWGFTCDCSLCIAESKTPRSQRQQRMRLISETGTLLSANPLAGTQLPNDKKVAQVSKRMSGIESTYDKETFQGMPQLGLVAPGLWLCQISRLRNRWSDVLRVAHGVLRALGFVLTVSEETVSFDRSYCNLVGEAIDAAIFAAQAHRRLGQADVAKQVQSFAAELYLIWNGEVRGFDEQYAEQSNWLS